MTAVMKGVRAPLAIRVSTLTMVFVGVIATTLTGCRPAGVLLVDPYMETLLRIEVAGAAGDGDLSRPFTERSLVFSPVDIGGDVPVQISQTLDAHPSAALVVAGPVLQDDMIRLATENPDRFIAVLSGSQPPGGTPLLVVRYDRRSAFAEAADLAVRLASTGTVGVDESAVSESQPHEIAVLFDRSTPDRSAEFDVLMEQFDLAGVSPRVYAPAGSITATAARDQAGLASGSAVIILALGARNPEAMDQLGTADGYIITEWASGVLEHLPRVVASVDEPYLRLIDAALAAYDSGEGPNVRIDAELNINRSVLPDDYLRGEDDSFPTNATDR
jgi:hypothetical protein